MAEQVSVDTQENFQSLPSVYKRALEILDELEKVESTSSDQAKDLLAEGVKICESGIVMINKLSLYSSNETIDETPTGDVKYMILPAFLGYFTGMISNQQREGVLHKSRAYYQHYLKLCRDYELPGVNIPESSLREKEDLEEAANSNAAVVAPSIGRGRSGLVSMASDRAAKIARLKEARETEGSLKQLELLVTREHVDDDVQRKYYMTMLKKWVLTALKDLDSIAMELEMLESFKLRGGPPIPDQPKPKAPQTFILARNQVQKAVYGLGYPSVPTYTVEEWYDQQVAEGIFPEPGAQGAGPMQPTPEEEAAMAEAREIEEEKKIEEDDPETRRKQIEYEEYTDDHRRGWGNMHGKG